MADAKLTALIDDAKLTELTELVAAAAADLLYIVDDPAGAPAGKKITVQNLASAIASTISLAASAITSGTLAHERGGLEADVSAYSGLVKINAGATAQAVSGTDYEAPGAVATHAAATSGVHGISAFGATLVDDADAATARATLGAAASSHNHAAGDINSGTFADARIAQSNVTQHVGAINHNALLNYSADQHRTISAGTFAARPAAGTAGRLYYATDRERMYYDSGSTWEDVGGPMQLENGEYAFFARAAPLLGLNFNGASNRIEIRDAAGAVKHWFGISSTINGQTFLGGAAEIQGVVNYTGVMGNSSKNPTTDAPADWVQVSIGGATYYLPAYAA